MQHRLVAVAVHQRDLVGRDAVVADHAVGRGVAVQYEVRPVGAEDAGGVALGVADGAAVLEEGTQLLHRDRQVGAEEPLTVVVEERPADGRFQERHPSGVGGGVPGVLVGVVEPAQRLEERRQDGVAVGAGGVEDTAGDEGRRVFQGPDVADGGLGHPQGQPFQAVVGLLTHHDEDGEAGEAAGDLPQDCPSPAACVLPLLGRQVPGDDGSGQAGLRTQRGTGALDRPRPPHLQPAVLQLFADPAQLVTADAPAQGILAQGQKDTTVRHDTPHMRRPQLMHQVSSADATARARNRRYHPFVGTEQVKPAEARLLGLPGTGRDPGDEQGDVVVIAWVPQPVQEQVTGLVQRAAGVVEDLEENVEAGVDRLVAGLDQAVGVENELVPCLHGEAGGVEGNPTAAQRRARGQVEELARAVRMEDDGRQVPGQGEVALGGVRVVDRVDTGRDRVETVGDVIEVVEYLGGVEVEIGQRPGGGAQLAHGGCGRDPAAHDVSDDESGLVTVQGDDVEPVASDLHGGLGGAVAGGDLQARSPGWRRGQQATLEGEGGVALLLDGPVPFGHVHAGGGHS